MDAVPVLTTASSLVWLHLLIDWRGNKGWQLIYIMDSTYQTKKITWLPKCLRKSNNPQNKRSDSGGCQDRN